MTPTDSSKCSDYYHFDDKLKKWFRMTATSPGFDHVEELVRWDRKNK